jgi:hypothetical protein
MDPMTEVTTSSTIVSTTSAPVVNPVACANRPTKVAVENCILGRKDTPAGGMEQ